MLLSSCACGPNPRSLVDSQRRALDPTGTSDVRGRMASDLGRRWRRVRTVLRQAIAEQDVLGLSGGAAAALRRIGDPIRTFQALTDETLGRYVLGGDGNWMGPYLEEAASRARQRAARLVGHEGVVPRRRTDQLVLSASIVELQGVTEVVSQRAVRAAGDAALTSARAGVAASQVARVIASVGVTRGRALVNFAVIRSFNLATLDALQDLGVMSVGVVAERQAHRVTDAVAEELVEVLTAGDDDVCVVCEGIFESGPYEIDDARGLIPAHPNCRCAFVPASDRRFAPVEREN